MTYHELIELYKTGKLEEAWRKQVEADIERQEAISEYLFEAEEIPELENLMESGGATGQGPGRKTGKQGEEADGNNRSEQEKEADAMEEKFLKMVRGSIRKAFVKMGVCVGAVLLVVILFIMFCLPGIVDLFYYDPGKVAAKGTYSTTNQMSLDMAVYSELFLPRKYRNNVVVDSNGYGEYDINIIQNASITGAFHNVAGKVEMNKLVLYDANLLTRPTGNAFVMEAPGTRNNFIGTGAAGTREAAYKKLDTLDENEYYMAYVTLSEVMTYAEFQEWFDTLDLPMGGPWCAVAEWEEEEDCYLVYETIGFDYSASGMCINFDREKYPYLSLLDAEAEGWPEDNPEIMQAHFVSMLRYMADQEEFCELIGVDYIDWEGFAQNVEEYGLYTYGFAVQAKPDALIALSEMDEVCYIYTTPIQ